MLSCAFICFSYAFHTLFVRFLYAFRTLFICFRFHMLFHSEIEVIMSKKAKRPLLLDAPRHLHQLKTQPLRGW